MNIYSSFVTDDELISPINGYKCKRITRQNIKQFGFGSIELLHEQYPKFPLICDELKIKRQLGSTKTNTVRKIHRAKMLEENIKFYTVQPKLCKICNSSIEYRLRNGEFCSRQCANKRNHSECTKEKIRCKITEYHRQRRLPDAYEECVICHDVCKVNPTRKIHTCANKQCTYEAIRLGASIGGRKSALKQVKRSKGEIKLFNLLNMHHENILSNSSIVDGWDADIILEDLKIAILWNGPWHYKEMGFGTHSLKQVVNRDCIKIDKFESNGWCVLIFEDRKWSPEEALIEVLLVVKKRIELLSINL